MIRLANQFDPPERRATVATATCCCCCCCCCLISAVGMTTFTGTNLSALAKKREQPLRIGAAIGAGLALCIFLPVIGAAVALGSISRESGGNAILLGLVLSVVLAAILVLLYWAAHEPRPAVAGFVIAVVGCAIAVGEAFLVLYGLFTIGAAVLVVYVLLLVGGIYAAVNLGPRVDWLWPR